MPISPIAEAALALLKTDASKILEMKYAGETITPGKYFPRANAQSPPELYLPSSTGTYLVICLDLDAPFRLFPFMSPINHWVQSGLKADASGQLVSEEPCIAHFGPPGPPPGAAPHRYVFLLYDEPADFDVKKHAPASGKKVGIPKRMRFDLGAFEKELKLGPIVALNYFESN